MNIVTFLLISYIIIRRNDDRRSALTLAAKNNELQVLSVLLNNNANVNDCDIDQVSKIKYMIILMY